MRESGVHDIIMIHAQGSLMDSGECTRWKSFGERLLPGSWIGGTWGIHTLDLNQYYECSKRTVKKEQNPAYLSSKPCASFMQYIRTIHRHFDSLSLAASTCDSTSSRSTFECFPPHMLSHYIGILKTK